MRFGRFPVWVLDLKLTSVQLRIAAELYGHASRDDYEAWVSVAKLCKALKVSRCTYWRAKTVLVKRGVLCFRRGGKRATTTYWLAVKRPLDFKVNTATEDFWEYQEFKSGKRGAPDVAKMKHADTDRMLHGMKHPMLHPMQHPKSVSVAKSPAKVIGFHIHPVSEQTNEQTILPTVRQTDVARRPGKGEPDGAGKEKSSMLDGQVNGGATEEPRRAPPAPPTGRRADADQSQVSLSDFVETPKKRKGKPLAEQNSPTSKLLGAFCAAYRERFQITYRVNFGRDMKLAKSLLRDFPADVLEASFKLYFGDADPFIKAEGYPFSLFAMRATKYAFHARRTVSGRSGLRSGSIAVGTRTSTTETATERIWSEWNGTEWVEHREPKPKAEKPKVMMDEGEEFE